MDSAQNQLADKIKTTNNVLISVSRDPSVDQLAAMLGLALAINKTGRHAAAVFSGAIPSTLEFLQPEATFEKNTDSLRDFIIALDKAKADKLRYKVEDDLVRIFITPYKTSLSDADLSFSQGDFNVDLVIALGVTRQEDLDEAITAHGRILHDATVTSITVSDGQGDQLGSINWHEPDASSLSELTTELIQLIDPNLIDGQIATSLLTGIVSETERFSNDKTSAQTMSISALLMAAGANQQLVASKLEEPAPELEEPTDSDFDSDEPEDEGDTPVDEPDEPKPSDGTIEINHDDDTSRDDVDAPIESLPEPQPEIESEPEVEPQPEEESQPEAETPEPEAEPETESQPEPGGRAVIEDSIRGGQLTASSSPEALDPATDPLGVQDTTDQPLLSRDNPLPVAMPEPVADIPATEPAPAPSLSDIEAEFTPNDEPQAPQVEVGDARDEVSKALSSEAANQPPQAIEALNAQPLGESLHPLEVPQPPQATAPIDTNNDGYTSVEELVGPTDQPAAFDPLAPPPVPPPLFNPAQFGQPPAGPSDPSKQQ